MTNLSILKTSIRQYENLYSVNDIHKVAGSEKKHEPNLFFRLEQTQNLIKEIQNENSDPQICGSKNSDTLLYVPYKSLRTGINKGTWACKELVIAYAAWISPAFHLTVLRAFLNQAEKQPKQLALPAVEKKYTFEFTEYELQQLAWLWFAFKRGIGTFQHIHPAFERMGSNMSGQVYGQAYEYLSILRSTNQILNRITEAFEIDYMTNWRVLQHLRKFDPKAVKIDLI